MALNSRAASSGLPFPEEFLRLAGVRIDLLLLGGGIGKKREG